MREPLPPAQAKQLIGRILTGGDVSFSEHALSEMVEDDLDIVDVRAVLRGGVVEPGEMNNGSWRYRVRAKGIFVVVAFRSETRVQVVTAWKTRH